MTHDQGVVIGDLLAAGGSSELGEGPPSAFTRALVADGLLVVEPQPDDGTGRALWRAVVTARGIREHRRSHC